MATLAKITRMGAERSRDLGIVKVAGLPLVVLIPIALLGPNTLLTLYACAVLIIGLALLWRPQEPLILLFLFLYQWVQANIATFYGNLLGLRVSELAEHSGRHEEAIYLLNTALVVLAVAMRVAAGRARLDLASFLRQMVRFHTNRTFVTIYVAAWLFSAAFAVAAPFSGGLKQIFLVFAEVKWAAFLLLTVSTFGIPGRSKIPWAIAFVVEFALAVGGFFAEFSSVFYFTLIGVALGGGDIIRRNKVLISVIVVIMLAFAVAWSAIKRDYRDFINAGTGEQIVVVGYEDRMADLVDRIAGLDANGMLDGADKLVRRLAYFEFFGVVLQRDAAGQPHSGGEIWGWGAASPFTPRLFFPDKPIVNDTALLVTYTGINQRAWRTGTSISLGYITEAFIDFGRSGMFAAIAALGLLIGLVHRWLLRQKGWRLMIGGTLVPVALMPAHLLEISAVKLLPSLVLSILAGWLVLRLLAPMLLRWVGVIRRSPLIVRPSQTLS